MRWSHGPRSDVALRCDGRRTRHRERGAAIVEVALIAPLLVLVVFSAIDLGRLAQYQNRTSNAAREAAMSAQRHPGSVDSGCRGDRNVADRARSQEPDLAKLPGYDVTYERWDDADGTWVTYAGCDESGALEPSAPPAPGARVRVTVSVRVDMTGPATAFLLEGSDGKVAVARSMAVVVQG